MPSICLMNCCVTSMTCGFCKFFSGFSVEVDIKLGPEVEEIGQGFLDAEPRVPGVVLRCIVSVPATLLLPAGESVRVAGLVEIPVIN